VALGPSQDQFDAIVYGSPAADVGFDASAALLVTAIGVLACWFPARRASSIHPMEALRHD
jgi:ABC-type lipoprotein release transport system permease subunit